MSKPNDASGKEKFPKLVKRSILQSGGASSAEWCREKPWEEPDSAGAGHPPLAGTYPNLFYIG